MTYTIIAGAKAAGATIAPILESIVALASNGLIVRTSSTTVAVRTITGVSGETVVTNGDGVSGNPTIGIGANVVTLTGTQILTNKTLASPLVTGIETISLSDVSTTGVLYPSIVRRITSGTPASGIGTGIDLQAQYAGASIGSIAQIDALTTALSQTADLVFKTANGGAPAERMRITAAGRLGIGTPAPATLVQANGVIRSTRIGDASQYIEIDGGNALSSFITATASSAKSLVIASFGDIRINPNSGSVQINDTGMLTLSALQVVKGAATNYFTLSSSTPSGNEGDVLMVNAAQNVGIGTNSPTERLDVNSDAIRIRTAQTPASAAAAGNQGELCWDANYVYVCVAANTWKRAELLTW